MDGVAARLEAGIFGSVAGYLGVIEAQMRKMLHLHMLVQLHGFSHPDDLFRRGDLEARIKRAWSFAASICFRSSEALAHYFHEDSAVRALRGLPLMPLNHKQRGMIGPERSKEVMEKQLLARGTVPDNLGTEVQAAPSSIQFHTWQSQSYADPLLSSADFASMMMVDCHAAVSSFGNHTCRSDVCHKGRLGKIGFCRMMFWHWYVVKRGQICGVRRRHGSALQERWDGLDMPPIQRAPPHLGAASLEMSHPFVMKLSPGPAICARCNHDLGLLFRFPDLQQRGSKNIGDVSDELLPSSTGAMMDLDAKYDAATELAIESTIETLIDHEYYCGAYASKEEPHIAGMMQSLSESVRHLEEELARQKAGGKDTTALDGARSLLHRLMSSTNKRMHKGFPEMVAYIMEKPEYIASMEFVPLYYTQVLISYVCNVESAASSKLTYSLPDFSKRILRPGQVPHVDHVDYAYRSEQLRDFPLCFFIAACEAHGKWKKSFTLAWWEPADGSRHPRSEIRYSSILRDVPLFGRATVTDNEPAHLRAYAYFLSLRTHKAWRCPELIGRIPSRIHDASTSREKGEFALFVMLLLRPYRSFETEILDEARKRIPKGSLSDADAHWMALYESYLTWRSDIEAVAKPLWTKGCSAALAPGPPMLVAASDSSGPSSSTSTWWACAIYAKLRNFDLVVAKHTARSSSVPTTVYGMPVVDEQAEDVASDSDNKEATGEDLSRTNADLDHDEADHIGEDDEISEVGETPRRRGDAARLCGNLTMDPDLFVKSLIPVESRGERYFKGRVKTGL
jgi:hypothetical protein